MVYQENSLVPSMSVAQNIYLGNEKFLNRLRGIYISAQQFLQSLNFHVDPSAIVGSLGAAQKQMVEIARAVHHKAKVIIFDEPTATLTPEEKNYFFNLIRKLKEDGVSIIFISPCARGGVADRRPDHDPARWKAGCVRRYLGLRSREDHSGNGRANPDRRDL
jgi:ABC-type sugar transport system ATPase subunit